MSTEGLLYRVQGHELRQRHTELADELALAGESEEARRHRWKADHVDTLEVYLLDSYEVEQLGFQQ